MKPSRALLAALVVLSVWIAGCSSGPTLEQIAIKDAFIRQLIGFCAEVDRQLANIDPKVQPGISADQFALFVAQARRQEAPEIDRDKFKIMLTKFDATSGQYRAAQTALTADDRSKADAALAQAVQATGEATNAAAQEYGMPPLDTCPQHASGTSPAPAPAAGW